MSDELKKIKKLYGEQMAHLCRKLFPTILEKEGILLKLLKEKFNTSKFLYDDIVNQHKEIDFKNYINSFIDFQHDMCFVSLKTAQELLDEVGYNLYECKSEKEIQYFKRYYSLGEELCTFKGNRLDSNYVFFAVKKDIDHIKRNFFIKPQRQDLYGTSIISIQFEKGKINTLSIKNRYNHKVDNPDATFSNNLELINKGLTASFERDYNLNILSSSSNFELNGYVLANDGKYYKYNLEIDNVYYCPNNIIIDNFKVKKFDTSRYLVIDYFIVDLKDKKIKTYSDIIAEDNKNLNNQSDNLIKDSFTKRFTNIKKIEVNNSNNGKNIIIYFANIENPTVIQLDKMNNIIAIIDNSLTNIDNDYLYYSKKITHFEAKKLAFIGDDFLHYSEELESLDIPLVMKIGDNFLYSNNKLLEFVALHLSECGDYFIPNNFDLVVFKTPKLKIAKNYFLINNTKLKTVEFEQLIIAGDFFLSNNSNIKSIIFPNLMMTGNYFLCNSKVVVFKALNLMIIGDFFLHHVDSLDEIDVPNLVNHGACFLYDSSILSKGKILNLSIK